jgi:hypothetical protein
MKRLLAALAVLLASCTQRPREAEQRVAGGPALFETAFVDGTRAPGPDGELTFTKKRIGSLKVSSGRIVAGDPLVLDDPEPFVIVFPIGAVPVELAVARIGNDERIAFARLLFSERPVVRWEPALLAGQDPAKLEPGELFGYGVDSGTGGFMDRAAAVALAQRFEKDDSYFEAIVAKMDETQRTTWSATLWELGKENAAFFSSGWGDGLYGSYVGYDASGKIARLLTDFEVAEWKRPPGR